MHNLPKPQIPTDEEIIEIANDWWKHHIGINFGDWNDTLRYNTFEYKIIPMSKDLIEMMIQVWNGKEGVIESLYQAFDKLISPSLKEMNCENCFFIKTISRSPKDIMADENNHGKPSETRTTQEALRSIINSMRCIEDITLLQYLPQAAFVVRPYIQFKPHEEWRVYIKDKKIVGISQYYYYSDFPELTKETVIIADEKIRSIINDIVIPNISISDFIADVIVGNENRKTVVLEANPYGLSDPCLFQNYDKFNGKTIWLVNDQINEL